MNYLLSNNWGTNKGLARLQPGQGLANPLSNPYLHLAASFCIIYGQKIRLIFEASKKMLNIKLTLPFKNHGVGDLL
jgi:hypothetical protein